MTIHRIITTVRNKAYIEIFDERKYPLGDEKSNFELKPTIVEVREFLFLLSNQQELAPEVAVMACTYIDRLISYTSLAFTPFNWRRIVLGAILVADKVAEEDQVWNVDYKRSLPNLSLMDLNTLERTFLALLKFHLTIQPSLYATYYFGLRAMAGVDGFPSDPLDLKTARKFELVTTEKERMIRKTLLERSRAKCSRSKSGDFGKMSNPNLCLEQIQMGKLCS